MHMKRNEYIDATVFLGMHSFHDEVRVACKNFFVERKNATIHMSLEQVGKCDDIIWRHSRQLQDVYYPFMDRLHSAMKIERKPYAEKSFEIALRDMRLKELPTEDKLLLAQVISKKGVLYTFDKNILIHRDLPVDSPKPGKELSFSKAIEKFYKKSLALKIQEKEWHV